ncbi:hypothetical protein [Dysgonomonas termitidis]|uniref:Integrase n=1 Tax=Dysgonomonas termitidis TaxID=1516126 RepID=A0ABV9KW64_9BACT
MENEELEKKINDLEKRVQLDHFLVTALGIFTVVRVVVDIIGEFIQAYLK